MKIGRRRGRARSAFDIPAYHLPDNTGPAGNEPNFARLISEMHNEIQEKEIALKEAWNLNCELGEKMEKMQTECVILSSQLEKSQSDLESARTESELLRITINDLQGRVKELENVDYERSENLDRMAQNLQYFESETEAYKFHQGKSDEFILQAQEEKESLVLEVERSRQTSIRLTRKADQIEEQHRLVCKHLISAEEEKSKLVKEIMEVKEAHNECQEENCHIREEIKSLKAMYENKIFELIDAEKELESLKRAADDRPGYDMHFRSYNLSCGSSAKSVEDNCKRPSSEVLLPIGSPVSFGSRGRETSLLVMMNEVYDHKTSASEAEDNLGGNLQRTSEPEEEDDYSEACRNSNKDMLLVYMYLTAAAVKSKYPDVDIKNWELIQLGQDMPFWELYPYFEHIFKGLKEKEKSRIRSDWKLKKQTENSGGWFTWMRGKESYHLPPQTYFK